MNRYKLIRNGYFPKELPPPFNTIGFSKKLRYIENKWNNLKKEKQKPIGEESNKKAKSRYKQNFGSRFDSSKTTSFSLPKGIYTRRKIEIPNPLHYSELCNNIISFWGHIKIAYQLSEISASIPTESGAQRAVRTSSNSKNEFEIQKLLISYDKRYEVTFDIVQFYPSIYTHTISWALLGKKKAKELFNISNSNPTKWESIKNVAPDAILYRKANILDTSIRNCQDKQSIGFPIGPDTSFILAEVIANRLDSEIQKKSEEIEFSGLRYYDDYVFYTNNYDDAERILKIGQSVFQDFQLESNEKKARISEIPFIYNDIWSVQLFSFKFSRCTPNNLRSYFSLIFSLIQSNKEDTAQIIIAGLSRFVKGYTLISDLESWRIFEKLLLKLMILDGTHLKIALQLFLAYEKFVNNSSKVNIKNVLIKIIEKHLELGHSFEIAWSLWIFKSLKISPPSSTLNKILTTEDDISKLIVLDLIHVGLFKGRKPGLDKISKSISSENFMESNWLFIYESLKKEWIKPRSKKALSGNEYMNLLLQYNVEFYDPKRQVEFVEIKKKLGNNIKKKGLKITPSKDVEEFGDTLLELIDKLNVENDDVKNRLKKVFNEKTKKQIYEKLHEVLKIY